MRIDAEQQVQLVRDERVGEMAPITLPVQEMGALSVINRLAGSIALGGAVLGLLLFIAGVVMRPERGEFSQAVAIGFAALAVLIVLFGYVVPVAVLPAISDNIWMGLFARLANDMLLQTAGHRARVDRARGGDRARHQQHAPAPAMVDPPVGRPLPRRPQLVALTLPFRNRSEPGAQPVGGARRGRPPGAGAGELAPELDDKD